jgi:hypothetical protein
MKIKNKIYNNLEEFNPMNENNHERKYLFSLFIIDESVIKKEYRCETIDQELDVMKLILDFEKEENSTKRKSSRVMRFLDVKNKNEKNSNSAEFSTRILPNLFKSFSIKKKNRSIEKDLSTPKEKKHESISLETILNNTEYLHVFKKHLIKEYCVENILFYEDVQVFKKENDPLKRSIIGSDIIQNFFDPLSVNEVNKIK